MEETKKVGFLQKVRNKLVTLFLLVFFFGIIFLVLEGLGVFAYTCVDNTEPQNIPCDIITPIINCSVYNYSIVYVVNGSLVQEGNLTALGDGTYYVGFNNTYGNYSITLCDSSSATLNVGYEEGFQTFYIYILIFVLAGVLVFFGYTRENYVLLMLAGFLTTCLSIALLVSGYPSFDLTFTLWLGIIFGGIGLYLIIAPAIDWIRESMD